MPSKIEKEIAKIKKRNKKVEADKVWETSLTRRLLIALMTYLFIVMFLWIIDISYPWLNAIVPTLGFLLSTLSLPFVKKIWLRRFYGK
jgi:sterol desaturase/sphingolipid hydroxylase (fatty acid hydroxylase superfamily)